jgi:hypothetical protein
LFVCLFVHTKIKNVAKTFQNDKSHVCSRQENCASEGGVSVSAKASKQLIKHCQMFFWFFPPIFLLKMIMSGITESATASASKQSI